MLGDYDFEEEIDIKEKHWKEAIAEKINSLKIELLKKNEELKIFKERLREIENAFCYNLNLLSDRDLELDALQNQLHVKVKQIETLIFRHNEAEKAIIKLDNERQKEMKLFQSQLLSKEQQICQLERKNKGNINTLKQTLEDMKIEYEEKISKLIWVFDNQKKDLECHFQMMIDVNAQNHLKETKEITKQIKMHIDLINREKEKVACLEAENKYFKQKIAQAERESEEKKNSLFKKLEEGNKHYSKITLELKGKKQAEDKELLSKPEVRSVGVQTYFDPEYDRSIRLSVEKEFPCKECCHLTEEIKKSNRNLQKEIVDLKNIVKDDRLQKAEEESIIQNLETSVYSLMSEMVKRNFDINENSTDQEILNHIYNKEIQNQIRITLFEHQFNKKLETLMSSAQEEKQLFLSKIDEMKRECLNKIEIFLRQAEAAARTEISAENLSTKIRQEIDHLENKIRNNFKDVVPERSKHDKSLQVSFAEKDENPFKMKSVSETVLITPDNKYWIFNRKNLPREKHIVMHNQIQRNEDFQKSRRGKTLNKPSPQMLPRSRFLQ